MAMLRLGKLASVILLDSAESFLQTSQAIVSIHHARFFRKPDEEWYSTKLNKHKKLQISIPHENDTYP